MVNYLTRRAQQLVNPESALWRVLQNISWMMAAQLGSSLSMLLQGVISSRALGVRNYGYYVIILSFTQTVKLLLSSRVWETIIRYIPYFRERNEIHRARALIKFCFWFEGGTSIVAFLVLCATAPLAARAFAGNESLIPLFVLFALTTIIGFPIELMAALMRLDDRFVQLAEIRFAWASILLLIIAAAALAGMSLELMICIQVVAVALDMALAVIVGSRSLRSLNLVGWPRAPLGELDGYFRQIAKFFLSTNLMTTIDLLGRHIDTLIVAWLGTPIDAGLFGLAKRIGYELVMILGQLRHSVHPEIAKLVAAQEHGPLRHMVLRLSWLLAVGSVIGATVLSFAAAPLIKFIFGEPFAGAIPLVQVLMWTLIQMPVIWVIPLMLAIGRGWTMVWINFFSALVLITSLVVLVPLLGGIGAAVAILIQALAGALISALVGGQALRNLTSQTP